MASAQSRNGGAGVPKRSAYQRCTRASLRISTGTGRSANSSAPARMTASSASHDVSSSK